MDMSRRTFLSATLATAAHAALAEPRSAVGPHEGLFRALRALQHHADAESWGPPRYAQFHTKATDPADALASLRSLAECYHRAFDTLDDPARLTLQHGSAGNAIATLHYPGGHNAVFVASPTRTATPSGIVRFAAAHGEIVGGAGIVHAEAGAGRALSLEGIGETTLNETTRRAIPIRALFDRAT